MQGAAPAKGHRSAGIRAGRANRQPKGGIQARNGSEGSQRNLAELQALQNLRLIYASARWHDAQVRRSVAISGSQLWALSEIARLEGIGINDLAERMALHQTTASNLANGLVKKGLIRRVRARFGVELEDGVPPCPQSLERIDGTQRQASLCGATRPRCAAHALYAAALRAAGVNDGCSQ